GIGCVQTVGLNRKPRAPCDAAGSELAQETTAAVGASALTRTSLISSARGGGSSACEVATCSQPNRGVACPAEEADAAGARGAGSVGTFASHGDARTTEDGFGSAGAAA